MPYVHVGAKADLKVSASTVEVWVGGERVATHRRFAPYDRWRYRTDESHMPPEFARASEWDDARILRWAREVGPNAHLVVSRIFSDVKVKEQGYNPALAVLNLSKRYGEAALEAACGYALERAEHPRCRFIRSILASGAAGSGGDGPDDAPGGYIRGASYYGGGDR